MFLKISFLVLIYSSFLLANETIVINKNLNEADYFDLNSQKYTSLIKKYRYFEVEIQNLGTYEKELYIGLQDDRTDDYWGQLTYKSNLSPGMNKLIVNVDRNVGERGSYKYNRKLNRKKIKKFFIVFNPEKRTKAKKIKINKIRFFNINSPTLPKEAHYILFNEKNNSLYPFAKLINPKTKYIPNKSAGFNNLKLWQLRDAKIAPTAFAKSMGVLSADFSIDLPKGDYQFELVWNELGYWDIPFWKMRKLFINGEPIVFESRSSWNDFLRDVFKFKDLRKKPFGYLMNDFFKPISKKVSHKGGRLTFSFEGDQSAVSLNSLLIYPLFKKDEVEKFKNQLSKAYELEFNSKYRYVDLNNNQEKIEIFLSDGFDENFSCIKKKTNNFSLYDSKKRIRVCIKGAKDKDISILSEDNIKVEKLVSSYRALDLNHESYSFIPYYFSSTENDFKAGSNNQVIEIEYIQKLNKKNLLKIEIAGKIFELKFNASILKDERIPTPVNIGFFGPSAMPTTYFSSNEKNDWINKLNKKIRDHLNANEVNFIVDGGDLSFSYNKSNTNFSLNSKTKNYFYVSENFKGIVEGYKRNAAQDEKAYFENLNIEFKKNKSIFLYSDEASGYRDAIEEDKKRFKELSAKFPALVLGGFGNLYDDSKASSLYSLWQVGYYTDIPNKKYVSKLNKRHTEWGIYNLCAEINAPLKLCYGYTLYRLYKAGVTNIIEWHLNSSQNYPYFDLDGREADIAFLETNKSSEIFETYRFREFQEGITVFKKLIHLESYLKSRKVVGLRETKLKAWLEKISKPKLFPVKSFISNFNASGMSNFYMKLDQFCDEFLRFR